jgi:hypothetical protein
VVGIYVAVGAAIGGFVGWLARTWVQSWFARWDRSSEREEARRERGLELLGEIRALLDDADPLVMSINRSTATPRRMQSLVGRWHDLRRRLVTYATAHSSEPVKTLQREFEDVMWMLLTSTASAVGAMTEGMIPISRDEFAPSPGGRLEAARHDYKEASKLLAELERAVRSGGERSRRNKLAA